MKKQTDKRNEYLWARTVLTGFLLMGGPVGLAQEVATINPSNQEIVTSSSTPLSSLPTSSEPLATTATSWSNSSSSVSPNSAPQVTPVPSSTPSAGQSSSISTSSSASSAASSTSQQTPSSSPITTPAPQAGRAKVAGKGTVPTLSGKAKQALSVGANPTALSPSATNSVARGDDYPLQWKNAAPDSVIDTWRLYNRECTSFTAYRLSSVNGFELPAAYGNGGQWGGRARREGYLVDKNPTVGSVAWLDDGGYGHVAWVSAVNGDLVEIEEYNFNWLHAYHRRTVHKSFFSGYIHFKDLKGDATKPIENPEKLPQSGTYYFNSRHSVKAEAKQSSSELAFYEKGSCVNYDQVIEADGYQWISYISGTGVRRYIAVKALDKNRPISVGGKINIQNVNTQAGTFDVLITDFKSSHAVKEVLVPVWTSKEGQDDIKWYKPSRDKDGNYKLTVKTADHKKETGDYNVHLYYFLENGTNQGVAATHFNIGMPSQAPSYTGQLHFKNINQDKGTFEVWVENVAGDNIKEIKVPVWSEQNGQDDIIWYTASKQSTGHYKVAVDIAKHNNDRGSYQVHLYYHLNNGQMKGMASSQIKLASKTKKVSLPASGTYKFTEKKNVQSEARIDSQVLAFYNVGDSVKYDKVLEADGHQWISYIASSGNRRYIAINKL